MLEEVMKIRQHFLSVKNRRTCQNHIPQLSHRIASEIKDKLSIHRIIHGHTDH